MSSQLKTTLDNIGPVAIATYIGYKTYKEDPMNHQRWILMALGIFIAAKYVLPMVTKEIFSIVDKPDKVDGGAPVDSRIRTYTDRLYNDIDGFAGHSSDLYKELAALPSADLLAIYNDWLDRYYHFDKENLITALNNETYWLSDSKNVKIIISKIQSMM